MVQDKSPKATVRFGATNEVKFYEDLAKEICALVGRHYSFTADESSFRSFLTSGGFDNPRLHNLYWQWKLSLVTSAYGVELPVAIQDGNVAEALAYVDAHRQHTPVVPPPADNYFLGIIGVQQLSTKDIYQLNHADILKSHVDFQTGYFHGKAAPPDPERAAAWTQTLAELAEFRQQVYGTFVQPQWKILTKEGDKLFFQNLNEVYCWLLARSANYSGQGHRHDW